MVNESNKSQTSTDGYRKKRRKEELKRVSITFILMLFLTIASFFAIAYPSLFPTLFSVPFILLLATVQVLFQLYFFMHMSHRGHQMTSLFLYSGLFVGLLTVLAFVTIIWI